MLGLLPILETQDVPGNPSAHELLPLLKVAKEIEPISNQLAIDDELWGCMQECPKGEQNLSPDLDPLPEASQLTTSRMKVHPQGHQLT